MQLRFKYLDETSQELVDELAIRSKLSKSLVKKVLNLGGCWITHPGKKKKRIKRATFMLNKNDSVEFYYEQSLLDLKIENPTLIYENSDFGVWYKPYLMATQPSVQADSNSLQNFVETSIKKPVYLVHRLDRDARGLVIFAYNKKMAHTLSLLWQTREVKKIYSVTVHGDILSTLQKSGEINFSLDGKEAITKYELINVKDNQSELKVELVTGRFHQIRRHFALKKFPVVNDPKYGAKFKANGPLALIAKKIEFKLPNQTKLFSYELPETFNCY